MRIINGQITRQSVLCSSVGSMLFTMVSRYACFSASKPSVNEYRFSIARLKDSQKVFFDSTSMEYVIDD